MLQFCRAHYDLQKRARETRSAQILSSLQQSKAWILHNWQNDGSIETNQYDKAFSNGRHFYTKRHREMERPPSKRAF